jgi:hypothetical protein
MEVIEFGPLTTRQRRELEGDERDPFNAVGITLRYRPKDRHVGLRDKSGRLVACGQGKRCPAFDAPASDWTGEPRTTSRTINATPATGVAIPSSQKAN